MPDFSSMSDDEFLAAWTEKGEQVAELKTELKEFSAEHDKRLLKAEEERKADKQQAVEAGEVDPSLDQVAGSVEGN